MDRVHTLANKLREQLAQNASIDQLLVTAGMLQSELLHKKQTQPHTQQENVVAINIAQATKPATPSSAESQEKTVELLQVDEAELEAELEEIKKNAQAKNNMGALHKPMMQFDPVEDIPTLTHQEPAAPAPQPKPAPLPAPAREPAPAAAPVELHHRLAVENAASVNERLKQSHLELGDSLVEQPIRDLKKAIGVNDRFVFINELFRGDEVMYERSIKTINSFSIYPEAEYWIKRELKLKIGWQDQHPIVRQFDQLIRRRFSAT